LGMREGWEGTSGQVLRDAGGRLGISLTFMLPQKGTPSEIERVFAEMEQQRPDAVLVSGEGDLYEPLSRFGARHRPSRAAEGRPVWAARASAGWGMAAPWAPPMPAVPRRLSGRRG